MPAETRQHGKAADVGTVTMLLYTLLSNKDEITEDTVLVDLGLKIANLSDLRNAVREDLVERNLTPEIDPGEFDPQMTVAKTAEPVATLLDEFEDADE